MTPRELIKEKVFGFEKIRPVPYHMWIDPEVRRQDATAELHLSGWAIHPEHAIRSVQLGQGKDVIVSQAPEVLRPQRYVSR